MLDRLLIVCWHNVETAYTAPVPAGIGRDGFRQQVQLLARLGRVVPLDEGVQRLREGSLGPRAIALTFDDGYRDNLEVAAPLLASYGLPATVFLVPEFLSGEREVWWERLAWALARGTADHVDWRGSRYANTPDARASTFGTLAGDLKALGQLDRYTAIDEIVASAAPAGAFPMHDLFLDWDGARRLADHGISAGGHSSGHAVLANETAADQTADLARCRRSLEDGLGVEVTTFAYPNGGPSDFNADSVAAASAAGFRCAGTGLDGWNTPTTDPYRLRRIFLNPAAGSRGLVTALKRWWEPRRPGARTARPTGAVAAPDRGDGGTI